MTHYEILGVSKNATNDQIKNAYKKLVKKYHPDVYKGDKDYADKKIKEINAAYDVLSDPAQKREYDEMLNPRPTYSSPSSSSYNYTPPKYTYNTSDYSYENYKKRYSQGSYSSYTSNSYKSTGGYGNSSYDYQRRYTDYHRSKTPNSNYTSKTDNSYDFTDNLSKTFDKFSSNTKNLVIVVLLFAYFIFVVINIFQLSSIFTHNDSSTTSTKKPSSNFHYANSTKNTVKNNYNGKDTNMTSSSSTNSTFYNQGTGTQYNPYLEQPSQEEENNSTSSNSKIPTLEEFDINDYYTDSELWSVYSESYTSSFTSFSEFKKVFTEAFYYTYISPYSNY